MTVIAIEEHYWDRELAETYSGVEGTRPGKMMDRLFAFDGERIEDMDRAGIDISVLSHGAPGAQKLSGEDALPLTMRVNDKLMEAVGRSGGRFAGLAALPMGRPEEAAAELERCVAMGMKGAMLFPSAQGAFLDDPRFLPVFERAEALDVPLYIHPALPHPKVTEAYFQDYMADYPMIARPAWGYTVETGTVAIRMVLSGLFDRHPGLKIILGHLGESIPFQMWRIDSALARAGQKPIRFREVFNRNFWVTTSGFFSTPALRCALDELGPDRVMFSVDWPFVSDSKRRWTG
ncbi:amidohydrolase family protein [Arenibacterium sp. LLYu02]|uniref:amidohydrolase family protein n=1 Tax=Arenibacterium sp. LLYu02 TaxID=3404132 RepID=UPI003B20F862